MIMMSDDDDVDDDDDDGDDDDIEVHNDIIKMGKRIRFL